MLQDTPLGMYPYLVMVGNAQTINAHNDFEQQIKNPCQQALIQVGNCIVLNQSTNRVSFKVEWNKQTFFLLVIAMFVHGMTQTTMPKMDIFSNLVVHVQQLLGIMS